MAYSVNESMADEIEAAKKVLETKFKDDIGVIKHLRDLGHCGQEIVFETLEEAECHVVVIRDQAIVSDREIRSIF